MYVVGSVANSMNEPHLKIIVNAILDLECCQDILDTLHSAISPIVSQNIPN